MRRCLSVIFFFSSVYPFLHNALLYCINLLANLAGIQLSPFVNLALIGWKDGVLILSLLVFFTGCRKSFGLLAIAALYLAYLTDGINGIKVLFEPAGVLIAFGLYRSQLVQWFRLEGKKLLAVLTGIVLFLLLIAHADLIFRTLNTVEQNNWTQYKYLLANNEYRCAKNAITGGADPSSLSCLHSSMNFYKLDIKDGEYLFLPALFLPVGDSVVLSTLLFYFLILYLVCSYLYPKKWTARDAFFIILLAYSIFKTWNRVNALFAATAISTFVLLKLLDPKKTRKTAWLHGFTGIAVLILYYLDSHYLILSLFNKSIPSNLGHAEAFGSIQSGSHLGLWEHWFGSAGRALDQVIPFLFVAVPAIGLWRLKRRAWSVGYLSCVASYYVLSLRLGIPLNFVLKGYAGPSESDFAKGLAQFGAVGVCAYSLILGYIAAGMGKLGVAAYRNRSDIQKVSSCALVFLMGFEFLTYQCLAPYFISGYVIFGSFMGIWFLVSESLYAREN